MELLLPYMPFGAITLILLILSCFSICGLIRRRKAICKVRCMCEEEKIAMINKMTAPFGFVYHPHEDVFANTLDCWQRGFGYCKLYDESARYFNMIIDSLPVYFDYAGRTWLIEFWKGQYALNLGAEIGTYHAERIVLEREYDIEIFHAAKDDEMLNLKFELIHRKRRFIRRQDRTWWLTGFYVGAWAKVKCIRLEATIGFPNEEMMDAFLSGLSKTGIGRCEVSVDREISSVTLLFKGQCATCGKRNVYDYPAQLMNRINIGIYNRLTSPFCEMLDKIAFVALWMPKWVRRIFRFKKERKLRKIRL